MVFNMLKTTSFKLDSELLKQIKIRATEKEVTQSELITTYLILGLKHDKISRSSIDDLEKILNIDINDHLSDIDYEIPKTLEFDPKNENKPINEEPIILENDKPEGDDIFKDIIGIVKSPAQR